MYIVTNVGTTDLDGYDAEVKYYVVKLDKALKDYVTNCRKTNEAAMVNGYFLHGVFSGVGFFLEEDITSEPIPDLDKLIVKVIDDGIWLVDDGAEIEDIIEKFGQEPDKMVFYHNSVIAFYTPNHFDGYITSAEITFEQLEEHINADTTATCKTS